MATAVNVYARDGFVPIASYDADNGNDVTNNTTTCLKFALSKNNVLVDGTIQECCPGKTINFASGQDADSIVVFDQYHKSVIDLDYIYAE